MPRSKNELTIKLKWHIHVSVIDIYSNKQSSLKNIWLSYSLNCYTIIRISKMILPVNIKDISWCSFREKFDLYKTKILKFRKHSNHKIK